LKSWLFVVFILPITGARKAIIYGKQRRWEVKKEIHLICGDLV
jgi:hypothetical protein